MGLEHEPEPSLKSVIESLRQHFLNAGIEVTEDDLLTPPGGESVPNATFYTDGKVREGPDLKDFERDSGEFGDHPADRV